MSAQSKLDFVPSANPAAFRQTMGQFATGVTIVTTMSGDQPVGLTANSFTSVSLDPALVLGSLGKSLGCLQAFCEADHFGINVLQAEQRETPNRFATKGTDRFSGLEWRLAGGSIPLLSNALANLQCRKHAELDYGDHMIFIGQVQRAAYDPNQQPLLYFGGQYRQLQTA